MYGVPTIPICWLTVLVTLPLRLLYVAVSITGLLAVVALRPLIVQLVRLMG